MSLVNCEECQNQISTRAIFCPRCGCPTDVQQAEVRAQRVETQQPEVANFRESFPHPGDMPQIGYSWNLQRKFATMGTIAGRNYDEIVQAVGLPKSRGQQPFGNFLCQWMSIRPMYHIALIFDQNGVCGGVTHESS